MRQVCSMLSVFSQGMLLQSDQVRACSIHLRAPLLTTKQPHLLWDPNLADDMRQACSMLSVFSRGMLVQSNQVRACLMRLRTPLRTTKQAATSFRTRISLMTCARSAPCFLCSRKECSFNQTRRAHDRCAYGRRCSQPSNRNTFRDPDLADDMR